MYHPQVLNDFTDPSGRRWGLASRTDSLDRPEILQTRRKRTRVRHSSRLLVNKRQQVRIN